MYTVIRLFVIILAVCRFGFLTAAVVLKEKPGHFALAFFFYFFFFFGGGWINAFP